MSEGHSDWQNTSVVTGKTLNVVVCIQRFVFVCAITRPNDCLHAKDKNAKQTVELKGIEDQKKIERK